MAIATSIDPLGHYLNYVADIAALRAELAGAGAHMRNRGTNREVVCQEFLKKHVPRCLGVFRSGPNTSGQLL